MIRVWTGWVLIILVLLQSGGYLISLRLLQVNASIAAHTEIQRGISQHGLVMLSESQIKQAIWSEKDEFQWEGAMYDVVRIDHLASDPIYFCHYDAGETAVKKLIAIFTQQKADHESPMATYGMHLLLIQYVVSNVDYQLTLDISTSLPISEFFISYSYNISGPVPPHPVWPNIPSCSRL